MMAMPKPSRRRLPPAGRAEVVRARSLRARQE
jgi:hypothetical protein